MNTGDHIAHFACSCYCSPIMFTRELSLYRGI